MTNPAERDNIARLGRLVGTGGRFDNAEGAFRKTISEYLNTTIPILTHPRVIDALSSSEGRRLIDISTNWNSSTLNNYGIPQNTNIALHFCLYPEDKEKISNKIPSYNIGIKGSFGTRRSVLKYDSNDAEVLNLFISYFNYRGPFTEFITDSASHFDSTEQMNIGFWETARIKPIQVEDFIKQPTLFPIFRNSVNATIEKVIPLLETRLDHMGSRVARNVLQEIVDSTVPGATVNFPPDKQVTRAEVETLIQQASMLSAHVRKLEQNGATKQDLQNLLTALMGTTAKDTTRAHDPQALEQAYTTLRYFAGGDAQAQQAVEAFITNSVNFKDPNRVFGAVLKIVGGFVPGAQGVVALVEALKEWTRP